jgi:hypothetical protein
MTDPENRRALLRRSAFLASSALAIGFAASCSDEPGAMPFDSATWLSAGAGDTLTFTTRGRMTDDLAGRVLQVGMPRAEVLALLGEPDQPATEKELVYYLGKRGSLVPTLSFLVLHFDRGALREVRVAED